MKRITILPVAIFLLAAAGCKKNKTEPPPPTGTAKIKTETSNGGSTTSYEYDAQGRRILVTRSNGSKIVYIYSGNIVSEKNYDNAGNFINESSHELNNLGLVIKTTYPPASISRTTYQYNAGNQLINTHFVSGPLSDSTDSRCYYSAQEKLDSIVVSGNNYTIQGLKYIYEYSLDKPNTVSNINYGLLYWGKENSSTPVTKYTVVNPDGSIQQVDIYTYEYDTYNRISKVIYSPTSFDAYTYY